MTWGGHFDIKWEPYLMRGPGAFRSGMNNNAMKTEQDLEPEDLGFVLDSSTDLEEIL